MTDAAVSREQFDIGRVLNRAFGVIGRNFAVFFGLSALLAGAPAAVIGLVTFAYVGGVTTDPTEAAIQVSAILSVVAIIVSVVTSTVLQGVLVHSAVTDLSGGRVAVGASLATGLRYVLALIVVSLLSAIAIALGLVALIVPGVILALMWSVLAPAVVVDRAGIIGSFTRSAQLTQGHRLSILGLCVIYVIGFVVFSAVTDVPGQMLAMGSDVGALIYLGLISPLQATVAGMVGAAGVSALYVELRQLKEGVGVEALAAVFD